MTSPSVGRMVHYVSHGSPVREDSRECRAAIITEVGRTAVGLCVLNPTGQFFNRAVEHDPGVTDVAGGTSLCDGLDHAGGTWHWPARV